MVLSGFGENKNIIVGHELAENGTGSRYLKNGFFMVFSVFTEQIPF